MSKSCIYELCEAYIDNEYDKSPKFIDKSYLINVAEIRNLYKNGYLTTSEYKDLLVYNDKIFDEIVVSRTANTGD